MSVFKKRKEGYQMIITNQIAEKVRIKRGKLSLTKIKTSKY